MDKDDLYVKACTEAGAKDPVAMAALLRDLIDEETQTMHQTRPRNILIRLKSLIDEHLKEA